MAAVNPEDVRELALAVQGFSAKVAKLEALPAEVAKLDVRGRRNRLLIWVTGLGLLLDLLISGVYWRQHEQQNCLSNLRVAGSQIADSDRRNVDRFFASVVSVKTPAQFEVAYHRYLSVRDANDLRRTKLGQADAATCPLL